MIYLLLGPFGFFLLFRIFVPMSWCIEFLYLYDSNVKYFNIVLFHFLFLFFQGILTFSLMFYTIKTVKLYRKYRNIEIYQNAKNREATSFSKVALIGIGAFLLLNYNSLPIFMEGGSDAVVLLGEIEKTKTWFMYGMLEIFSTLLVISIVNTINQKRKFQYGILYFMAAAIGGKKAAIIGAFSKLIFLYYLFSTKKPNLPIVKILIGLSLSAFFIVMQFSRTAGFELEYARIFDILQKLIYSSSTVYLEQLISMDGLQYAENYSDHLGSGGSVLYILNPFVKFLFGIGIDKSIGPYIMEQFYGATEIPNGVNPTLFFEYIFVYGSLEYIIFAFLNLFFVFILARYFIKKVIVNFNTNILLTVTYFGLFMSCFGFLADTLNTVRSLPFTLLPMFAYYFYKFLVKVSHKQQRRIR